MHRWHSLQISLLILIDPLAAIGAPDIFLKLMVGLRPKEVKSQALIGGANITSLQIIDKRLLFDGQSIRQLQGCPYLSALLAWIKDFNA